MKHERNIGPEKWRLKKTLSRRVEVRAMEPDDIKYLWAAYKKGALAPMGAAFAAADMTAEEFRAAFEAEAARFTDGWTILTQTARGFIPTGAVFGKADGLPFMIVAGITWFPWASRRNIVEGAVAFFNALRKQVPLMLFATDEHKRIYEVCCMHGIMRRVGTSRVAFPGKSAAVFEGRIEQ